MAEKHQLRSMKMNLSLLVWLGVIGFGLSVTGSTEDCTVKIISVHHIEDEGHLVIIVHVNASVHCCCNGSQMFTSINGCSHRRDCIYNMNNGEVTKSVNGWTPLDGKCGDKYYAIRIPFNDSLYYLVQIALSRNGKNYTSNSVAKTIYSMVNQQCAKIHKNENHFTRMVGESVTIFCNASGFPVPSVSWSRKVSDSASSSINLTGPYLYSKKLTLEDTGMYDCIASNIIVNGLSEEFCTADSWTIYLEVVSQYEATNVTSENTTSTQESSYLPLIVLVLLGLIPVILIGIFCRLKVCNQSRNSGNLNLPSCVPKQAQCIEVINFHFHVDYYRSKQGITDSLWEKLPQIPLSNIDNKNGNLMLGKGKFGNVYYAYLKVNEQSIPAAIKELSYSGISGEGIIQAIKESSIVASLKHKNILELYGIHIETKPFLLVFEYMEEGDLKRFLQHKVGISKISVYKESINSVPSSPEVTGHDYQNLPLTNQQLLYISLQVAEGMAYLTERDFVHKDLAARNCLVGKNLTVKVADFGLSCSLNQLTNTESPKFIPVRNMPPETITNDQFTHESDVWSFGVLLWEIYTFGIDPYPGRGPEEIFSILRTPISVLNVQPYFPQPFLCPDPIYQILTSCLQAQYSVRPSFFELRSNLSSNCRIYLTTSSIV